MPIVPTIFEEWEHCITVKCGTPLTSACVAERIAAMQDTSDFHTQTFIEPWGASHHARTLTWFHEAESRLTA